MAIFEDYSNYYDLLYHDKDYQAEADYVESLLKKYSTQDVKTILDLGCGTGGHAFLLAEKGYRVTGVDRAESMLSIAREKTKKSKGHVDFVKSDICDFNLNKKFDAAIAMFAVMGYQTTNNEFGSALTAVRRHLNPKGLFIFDVWFGPAVLSEKPTVRVKIIEKDISERVIRIAQPKLNVIRQLVQVDYTTIHTKEDKILEESKESHLMRYFFYQELPYHLENNGFELLKICPFMDLKGIINERCWNISIIASGI